MPQPSFEQRPQNNLQLVGALLRGSDWAWIMPLAGMLIGFVMAGAGIMSHESQQLDAVPPGYVVLVNGKGILESDFMSQTAAETDMPFERTTLAQRSRVLNEMVNEELLVQRALVLDLPETTTEVRSVMMDAMSAQASAALLSVPPTEEDLRAYYEAHVSRYTTDGTMTLHDLVLGIGGFQNPDQSTIQAQADAAEAVYQLRSGASIDYIKEHFGFVDSSRISNGTEQLDVIAKMSLGAKLYTAAAMLSDGAISDPIPDSDGVHVLVMDQRVAPTVAPFSDVQTKVYTDYRASLSERATQANLKILRNQARIVVAAGERL
jgi:hypothetical protein